ncbi:hypothetical protein [Thermus sp.]|uniref:hypothetical protein n=1 Tax=Thermus sp. TaxID=275 RepID=UPI003D127E89
MKKAYLPYLLVLATSVLGSGASAKPYPLEGDDRRFAELANGGRYPEAYALAESALERFAHWYAHLLFDAVPPKGTYSPGEATVRAAEHACRYREANLEAAAYCYDTLALILRWKDQDPRIAQALPGAKLPELSPSELDQGLRALAEKGISYAAYLRNRAKPEVLERLVRERPHSLGGQLAAGFLANRLWERGDRGSEMARYALLAPGVSSLAGGVLAWAEYFGQGVKRNREAACPRAAFWATRSSSGAALLVLGLCYWEGAAGFPKDPIEAYGILWYGQRFSNAPDFGTYLAQLEKALTPEQQGEGRRRAANRFP